MFIRYALGEKGKNERFVSCIQTGNQTIYMVSVSKFKEEELLSGSERRDCSPGYVLLKLVSISRTMEDYYDLLRNNWRPGILFEAESAD